MAGITILFFGLAVGLSVLSDPQYEVKATVQTRGVLTGTPQGGATADGDRLAATELGYLDGFELALVVGRVYDGPLSDREIFKVEAQDVIGRDDRKTSNVVELTLVSGNPEEAAYLLNIYARTYVEGAQTEEAETFFADLSLLYERLRDIEAERQEAQGNEQMLTELNDEEAERQRQIHDMELNSRLTSPANARILSAASVPSEPISPNLPRNLAIGLLFGLFLGVAAAFLREYFDDSVKSKEIAERVTGVPALGLIPKFDTSETELVAAASPGASATEAFRSLRTSVKFVGVERDVRVVQVTSSSPGEGKTLVAANLATVLAQTGDRVVLVSADLRRPRAEELVGVPLNPGLTSLLIGEVALPQAVRPVEGVPNLSVLPAGQPPPNPSELLSGDRARRLIDVLAQTYDMVILDSAPVLPVTDALVLAHMADATLLVTSGHKTSRRELARAVELLNQMDARLTGTVMTGLAPDEAYTETYGYDSLAPPIHKPRRLPASGSDGLIAPGAGAGPDTAPVQPAASAEVWGTAGEGMPDGTREPEPWNPGT